LPFQPLLLIFAIAGRWPGCLWKFRFSCAAVDAKCKRAKFSRLFFASATETAQRGHVHDAATQIGKQGKENTTTHTHAHTRAQKRQTNIENSKEKRPGKWGTNEGVLVL